MTIHTMILVIGALDAVLICILGGITAVYFLVADSHPSWLEDRVWPAVAILIGTSLAAGIVMVLANWLAG